eukprot:scaffold33146_cov63-Cyclotella_meneghiniana.AAC.3
MKEITLACTGFTSLQALYPQGSLGFCTQLHGQKAVVTLDSDLAAGVEYPTLKKYDHTLVS